MNGNTFLTDLFAAWNAHDRDRLPTFYHPDYRGEDYSEGKTAAGSFDAMRMFNYILSAFPDVEMKVLDWGQDGDKIFCFWTAEGTHRGRLMNIPPTGKTVVFMGSTFFTLRDGKILHSRRMWDVASMLRQIGLLPEIAATTYR